jgi:aryl-alcohol dehydrogenase-like predicted oxidoreductase
MALDPADLGLEGASWTEIALRFTLSRPEVHVISVGTTRLESAEANLEFLEAGPLPPEAVGRIRRAFRDAQTHAGVPWPGLT